MPGAFKTVRVLVVDDHPAVRAGVRWILDGVPDLRVVGEASRAAEAVSLCAAVRPDVVLMDVRLAGGNGIEACRRITADRPEARVVMLSAVSDEETVAAAVLAGASGYLLKRCDDRRLTRAVREAAAGGCPLDPGAAGPLLRRFRRLSAECAEAELQELTIRERRILALLAEGCTNRDIGAALHLSEKTVRNGISRLMRERGFRSRSHAAAWAGRRALSGGAGSGPLPDPGPGAHPALGTAAAGMRTAR
jgi:DNA-binding NarL/FixJ family response regulator